MPSCRTRDTASRMTVRLTPNCSASMASVGSFSPGSTRPSSISASRRLATVSVSVGGEGSLGNAMDDERREDAAGRSEGLRLSPAPMITGCLGQGLSALEGATCRH
ncbi:hypothetical protein G6F60_014793 [Rhizopus arrhizus]|nr:hypothetical protein G6F60_014793 [Rhizopus arrhizus]